MTCTNVFQVAIIHRAPAARRQCLFAPLMSSSTNEQPYLTHAITHHGQSTLVPPQNAGRVRKTPKKTPKKTATTRDKSRNRDSGTVRSLVSGIGTVDASIGAENNITPRRPRARQRDSSSRAPSTGLAVDQGKPILLAKISFD